VFASAKPYFEITTQDVEKFFAFVFIGFTASTARFDAEEVRLHGGLSPREKLHAYVGRGFENFSLRWANKARVVTGSFKERKNIGAIEASNPTECGDGGAHLAAFQCAEKADRNFCGFGYLCERKSTANSQTAKTLAGKKGSFGLGRDNALTLENVNDGSRVETARATKKNSTLEQTDVIF
jgi:hypothetical protein